MDELKIGPIPVNPAYVDLVEDEPDFFEMDGATHLVSFHQFHKSGSLTVKELQGGTECERLNPNLKMTADPGQVTCEDCRTVISLMGW